MALRSCGAWDQRTTEHLDLCSLDKKENQCWSSYPPKKLLIDSCLSRWVWHERPTAARTYMSLASSLLSITTFVICHLPCPLFLPCMALDVLSSVLLLYRALWWSAALLIRGRRWSSGPLLWVAENDARCEWAVCVCVCKCVSLFLCLYVYMFVCLFLYVSVMMMNVCGSRGMGGEVRRGNYCPVLHSRTLPQAEGS